MLLRQFNFLDEFNTIVFSSDIMMQEEEEEAWVGFVQSIKNYIQKENKPLN